MSFHGLIIAHFFLLLYNIPFHGLPVCISIHLLKGILIDDAFYVVEFFIDIIVDSHVVV